MGTDTDTKKSSPNEINPPEEMNPDQEASREPDGEVSEDIKTDEEAIAADESSEDSESSVSEPEKESIENDNENNFSALTDDDVEDSADNASPGQALSTGAENKQKNIAENDDDNDVSTGTVPDDAKNSDKKNITPLKSATDSPKEKGEGKGSAKARKLLAAAVIILVIAGYVVYNDPAIVGFQSEEIAPQAVKTATEQPVEPAKGQAEQPKPVGKQQVFLSKLNQVDRLREKLLAKKEEIYRLKLHYHNGIVELKDQIDREIQEAKISSLAQALKNKRIELSLRTIQRRQNYIRELEKPDQWAHNGSEELLYLKRKAELDLQMADVASGIDLDRHMRYINSAIQKYQPSAEKLAVDPLPVELTPLENIWDQIIQQQTDRAQASVEPEDKKIIAEICSGNSNRIAELSAITAEAARCLSRVNSPDLFLNGLTKVSPEDAKYLFKWPGNWICLNSIKELSPAVARYLFSWNGKWISLNGLTEFPPELAVYLMEWKGSQLELMGLKYDKSKPDRKALKYLALWETMGGKLFVSDRVRKEMNRVM